MKNEVAALLNDVLGLCSGEANRARETRWRAMLGGTGTPQPLVFARPLRPYCAQKHGLSLRATLEEPESFLHMELATKLAEATDFGDDTWISPVIDIWLGVVFESTLFGVAWHTRDDTQAWFGEPVLPNGLDDRLVEEMVEGFDFHGTGMMSLAHRLYGELSGLTRGSIQVMFPRWFAGNLRVAQKLRGDTSLFHDFHDDPDGVRRLMDLITRMRRGYEARLARELGAPRSAYHHFSSYMRAGHVLGNDEVDGNIFSAATYRDLILPSDRLFCEEHRDIYYHSCGNLNPMFDSIRGLPHRMIQHVSSLSSFDAAVDALGPGVVYEKAFADWDPRFAELTAGDTGYVRAILERGRRDRLRYYFLLDVESADPRSVSRARSWVATMKEMIRQVYAA